MKPAGKPSEPADNATKAVWLYFLLPGEIRRKINSFLSPAEQGALLKKREAQPKDKLKFNKETLFRQISEALKGAAATSTGQKNEIKNLFLGFHALLHLTLLGLALLEGMNFMAGVVFFYAVGGMIFILQKSSTYLQYRYSPLPFYPQYAFISVLSYSIMVLTVGWLSVNADFPAPDAVTLVVGALLAPFFEELLFRDVIYNIVEDITNSSFFAIAVGALFFALVHFQGDFHIFDLLIYILAGALLGVLRWSTGKLFYPILVHAGVNLTILLL